MEALRLRGEGVRVSRLMGDWGAGLSPNPPKGPVCFWCTGYLAVCMPYCKSKRNHGPYTGTWFDSIRETDIEHIVARSEAHDSGLCAAGPATRAKFASDLLNLTLASPSVNRHQKSDKDAVEWLPDLNEYWYVGRTIQVRLEYGLTIDRPEADAVDKVLGGCESFDIVVLTPRASATADATPTRATATTPSPDPDVDALALWDDNGNGRITCAEARAHGIAPVHQTGQNQERSPFPSFCCCERLSPLSCSATRWETRRQSSA